MMTNDEPQLAAGGEDEEFIVLSELLVGDGEDLDKWLKETGFKTTKVPGKYEPQSPKNLNALNPKQLGDLFDEFGEWFDFLIREEAMIANELAKAKAMERLTRNYVIERRVPGPVTQREKKALLDRDVVYAMSVVARAQEKLRIIEARISSIQGTLRRISRHIALRDPSADLWLRSQTINSGRVSYSGGSGNEQANTGPGRPIWGSTGLRPPTKMGDSDD